MRGTSARSLLRGHCRRGSRHARQPPAGPRRPPGPRPRDGRLRRRRRACRRPRGRVGHPRPLHRRGRDARPDRARPPRGVHPSGFARAGHPGRPRRGRLGVVRKAPGPVARRVRQRGGTGTRGRPLRLVRVPAPVRLSRPSPAAACPGRGAGAAAGSGLPHAVVPRSGVLQRAMAGPLGDRGRRPDDGTRHPPDGRTAGHPRRLARGAGAGGDPRSGRGDRGRVDGPGHARERCPGQRRQQRAVASRGELPAVRLPGGDRRGVALVRL